MAALLKQDSWNEVNPVQRREPICRVLTLDGSTDSPQLERSLKGLDSPSRLRILRYLADRIASVNDIAAALELPSSTVSLHVDILEEAGLIHTELEPASRGLRKICSRLYDQIVLDLPVREQVREHILELSAPIGTFVDAQVTPTCGILGHDGPIGIFDDPASFYEPQRVEAQLLWFHQGYVEYRFPNRLPPGSRLISLRLSFEACSEAPLYNPDWPSDITVWVNGVEIGCWTSPSDFGGIRGRLTPEWWTPRNSQHGLLKVWHISQQNTNIDGSVISAVTIDQVWRSEQPYVSVRIGVRANAEHVGGLNLFGHEFGNHPQDIMLLVSYSAATAVLHEDMC